MDMDVLIKDGRVVETFRLEAGFPTLELCLEHADKVVVMGHVGRPGGQEVKALSVAPVHSWLEDKFGPDFLEGGKLCLLENLRFETGEDTANLDFAKKLAAYGNFFVNEAFAAHHRAASTTVLPTLLPHAAGLRFFKEVEVLNRVRQNPEHPFIMIIGGIKLEDKLPAVEAMLPVADAVLVGGKIAAELKRQPRNLGTKVLVAKLNEDETDVAPETIWSWERMIATARTIIWNGPVGKTQNLKKEELGSNWGTYQVAQLIIQSKAESIIGGGDTVGFLGESGLLEKFGFVSTGGGAMLKFLSEGTLPTIEALA